VIHRASQLFLPTLREPPADAEAVNHKLLVRGAFVRQLTAGVWTFLPLGWRVHRKIERIIREEMNAIGSQEMLMPLLTPAELWERSGRGKIDIIFNTPLGRESFYDDTAIRKSATLHGVLVVTTLTAAAATVKAIQALRERALDIVSLQEIHAAAPATVR